MVAGLLKWPQATFASKVGNNIKHYFTIQALFDILLKTKRPLEKTYLYEVQYPQLAFKCTYELWNS